MKRVLIVDDEPLIILNLTKKVEESGLPVLVGGTAKNGVEALEWLENNYVDICITDISMPIINGLELIEKIKSSYPWIECIIVSSYDDFAYAKNGIKFGIVDYILKPIHQEHITNVLQKTISGIEEKQLQMVKGIILENYKENTNLFDIWISTLLTCDLERIENQIENIIETYYKWITPNFWLLDEMIKNILTNTLKELEKKSLILSNINLDFFEIFQDDVKDNWKRFFLNIAIELTDIIRKGGIKHDRREVDIIKDYLNEYYKEKITLQEIADYVNLSRTYISFLFKSETNETIWNYLLRIRMEKAKQLLLETDMKCYEIGFEVGYNDNTNFSRVFKEYFGCNGLDFRKNN